MSFLAALERRLVHAFWLLPPDLHERQRYMAARIPRGQTILDVGGEQPILGQLTTAKDYYTINIQEEINQTPEYTRDPQHNLFYDGQHIPFPDKHFDVVVCVDVLEHVPQPQRRDLIAEMLRVTKKQLICSAPLGTPEHIEAEKDLYQTLNGRPEAAFLADHIKHGLPTPQEVQGWAKKFQGQLRYSGDFRWSNLLFVFQISEVHLPVLKHLYFFAKLAVYGLSNLLLYPFLVGRRQFTPFTNRFYLEVRPTKG